MERVLTTPLVDTLAATGDRWNLCDNPSFEAGKSDGWFWQGTFQAGTGVVSGDGEIGDLTVFGDYSLAVNLEAQYASESLYTTFISDTFAEQEWVADLQAASKITYSVYVKPEIVDGASSEDFVFTHLTGFHGTSAQGSAEQSVPFGEWTRVWVTCDVPADGDLGNYIFAQLKFDQGFPDGVNKIRFLVDGALVEPSDGPLPYFDGSFDGAEWLGAPHQSASKSATPFTPEVRVSPDEANHRVAVLVIAKQGYTVEVVREVNGGLPQIVRGLDNVTLETDQQLFFDYEVPQGDLVTYLAVIKDLTGKEFKSPPVYVEPQNYGGDIVFPLNDPINALQIHIEQISNLNYSVSQNVLKVWNRPDPIVVSGVREYPSGQIKFVTFTDRERQTFLKMLRDGGVIGLNPNKSDTGFDGIAYFNVGQVTENRLVPRASDPMRRWDAQIQQVNAPPATWPYPTGSGETWGELERTDDDWSLVSDELWIDVLDFGGEELVESDSSV